MPIKFYWTNLSDHNLTDEEAEKNNNVMEGMTEKVVQIENDEDSGLLCAQINPKKLHEKFQEFVKDKNGLFTSGLEDFQPDLSACSSSSSIGNDSITSGDERSSSLLVRKNKTLRAANDEMKSRIDSVEKQLQIYEKENEHLLNRNLHMEQNLIRRQSLEEEQETLQEELDKFIDENKDLKNSNGKLHNEIAALRKGRSDDDENIARLNNQVLTLLGKNESLSTDNKSLCQEMVDLRDQIVNFEEEIHAKEDQINKAMEQYHKESALRNQYQKRNEQLKQENEQLNGQIQDLQYESSFPFSAEAVVVKNEAQKPKIRDLFSELKEAEEVFMIQQMNESNSTLVKEQFDCDHHVDKCSQTMPEESPILDCSNVSFDENKKDNSEEIRSLKEKIEALQNEVADGQERKNQMIEQNEKSGRNIALFSDVNNKMLQGKLLEWYDGYKKALESDGGDEEDQVLPNLDHSESCISSRLDALNLDVVSPLSASKKSTWLSRTRQNKVFDGRKAVSEIIASFDKDVATCEARNLVTQKCRQIVFYHISKKIEERYTDGSKREGKQNNEDLLWKLVDYLDKYSVIIGSLSCERKILPVIKLLLDHGNNLFAQNCSLQASIEALKLKSNIVPSPQPLLYVYNTAEDDSSKLCEEYKFSKEFLENAKFSPFKTNSPEQLLPNILNNVYSYSCSAMLILRKIFSLFLLLIVFGLLTLEMPDEYRMNPPVY